MGGPSLPPILMRAAEGDDGALDWCRRALTAYFHETADGLPVYSGARFEALAGGGDRDATANVVEVDDLVAVSTLSVRIWGPAAIRVLERDRPAISELLRSITRDVDLIDAGDDVVGPRSPAHRELWPLLRGSPGAPRAVRIGPVTTSKLLARKRPRLFPIFDSVVKEQLGLKNDGDHWRITRDLLVGRPGCVGMLRRLHEQVGLSPHTSLIRTLDILLWMSDRERAHTV